MTNTISFWLGLLILGFFAVDYYYYDWQLSIFVARKMLDMIEYFAFWR
jgi:hypothetical protein